MASKEIRIVSLKDDEFLFTRAEFDDVMEKDDEGKAQWIQKNIQYFEYIFTPVRAFSINWPYVAFSGLGNYLLIVNAFDRKQIRRIQIAEEDAHITIC